MSTNVEIAGSLYSKYEHDFRRARNATGRTEGWKRAKVAQIHLQFQAELNQQIHARDTQARAERARLEYRIFGPAGDSNDASEIISRRDAGDRAKQLTTEQEALDLLASADRIRDESLARAIAERCFEMGWGDAVNEFLRPRQHLLRAAQSLWDQTQPSLAEELSEAAVTTSVPPELRGLSESQIARLAESIDD